MTGSPSDYDSALQVLRAKRDRLRSELSAVLIAIASLEDASIIGKGERPDGASANDHARFDGMTQPEMAAETLRAHGKPMTAREVLDVWTNYSRAPTGPNREQQVQTAFRNRAKTAGDVVHVGEGRWGLCEWYSQLKLQEIRTKTDAIDAGRARDKKEHIAKTVEGIRKSQANGVYHGAPPKLTPEQWQLAVELATKGVALREVHRQLVARAPEGSKAVSYQTIHYHGERLKNGEPYPDRWRLYFAKAQKSGEITSPKLRW